MDVAGFVIAISVSIFVTLYLSLAPSGERWKAAEAKAKARRLADARINARLLRLNL
jgi:hypothetical protein